LIAGNSAIISSFIKTELLVRRLLDETLEPYKFPAPIVLALIRPVAASFVIMSSHS
jgi:hypothetical protein